MVASGTKGWVGRRMGGVLARWSHAAVVGWLALAAAPAQAAEGTGRAPTEAVPGGAAPEILWVNAEAGISHVGLTTFRSRNLLPPNTYTSRRSGPLYGAAVGVRVDRMTFGVRGRYGTGANAFDHGTAGVEAAYRPVLGAFAPFVGLGAGYVEIMNLSVVSNDAAFLDNLREESVIYGLSTRLIGGFDYRFAGVFSAGLAVAGELLLLKRDPSGGTPMDVTPADGSGMGGAVSATASFGLHI